MVRKRRSAQRAAGRQCVAAGCTREVQSGRVLCREHTRNAYGREMEAAIGRMARQVGQAFGGTAEGREETAMQAAVREAAVLATLEGRLTRGDFGGLFDDQLRASISQTAIERGIAEEIGALRIVLARLMTEPDIDPLHLAHGVARVAGLTVRAMLVQRQLEESAGREMVESMGWIGKELQPSRANPAEQKRRKPENVGAWADRREERRPRVHTGEMTATAWPARHATGAKTRSGGALD